MQVRTEIENQILEAVVFGRTVLASKVGELLSKQQIKVNHVENASEFTPEGQPKYFLMFLTSEHLSSSGETLVRDFLHLTEKYQGKGVVVLESVLPEQVKSVEEVVKLGEIVEIRSKIVDPGLLDEVAGKIVRKAMSKNIGEKLIVGEFMGKWEEKPVSSAPVRTINPGKVKKVHKFNFRSFLWTFGFILILVLPLIVFGVYLGSAGSEVLTAKEAISKGDYKLASEESLKAREKLTTLNDICVNLPFFGKQGTICEGFLAGSLSADTLHRGAKVQGEFLNISRAFFSPSGEEPDLKAFAKTAAVESEVVEENLGFLEAGLVKNYTLIRLVLERLGISKERLDSNLAQLARFRVLARAGKELAPVTPDVLGVSTVLNQGVEKKTYLIIFQNSAELRATGGFIGSYAIVSVDKGRLLNFKIHDVYSSDGQLRGHITPPDEILHYLGQPSWFMRDANFAPDFPLTAKRLAWFLEKETGQKVDGVIAMNIGAVENIIKAMGEVKVQSSDEPVTAANFFEKAEYASEINFFPGSTQKRDFLGEVSEAIMARIVNEQDLSYSGLAEGLTDSLEKKDIMFYFNSLAAQKAVEEAGFSGSIVPGGCLFRENCVMVVEDNFGANKANYFIKKEMKVNSLVDKGGGVTNTVTVTLDNQSPSDSWPGGRYKNYIRFLVPKEAEFLEMDLGDSRVASVSTVLTEQVLANVPKDKYLVYATPEQLLTTRHSSPSAYMSYGALVEVPVSAKRTIKFKYLLEKQLDFAKDEDRYNLTVIKQPGSVYDPLEVRVEYPTFLKPVLETSPYVSAWVVKPQEIIYNTKLDKDRVFDVKFKQR